MILILPGQEILLPLLLPHTSFYAMTQLLWSNISPITVTMRMLFQSDMFNCSCEMRVLGPEMAHFSQLIGVRAFPMTQMVKHSSCIMPYGLKSGSHLVFSSM